MHLKPQAITEGIATAAAAVVLSLLSLHFPLMIFFYLLSALPIAVLAVRQRLAAAVTASLGAMALLAAIVGVGAGISFALYFLLVGCALGYGLSKGTDGFRRIGLGYFGCLAFLIGLMIIYQAVTGHAFVQVFFRQMQTATAQWLKVYAAAGHYSAAQIDRTAKVFGQALVQMKRDFPTMVLLIPFGISWILNLLLDLILARLQIAQPRVLSLSHWRLPKSLRDFLFIVLMGLLVAQLAGAGSNLYVLTLMGITTFVYGLMGLSCCFWFFNSRLPRESMGRKTVIVLIVMVVPSSLSILSILGVLDAYTPLRLRIILREGKRR